ncbi:MAG: hypothetical protein NXI31_17665 [bacterium]|nr:hypothetical protein [bacterium]
MLRLFRSSVFSALATLSLLATASQQLPAQDNILIFGNSILFGPTAGYLTDLVTQTGAPTPNVVPALYANGTTTNYVNNQGLIGSSLPAGQSWDAMIVQGGTLETTDFMGQPAAFQTNMLTLANTYFAHSPQGLFVGHETGADHPNSSRYPSWFDDAAEWLSFPQAAYAEAAAAIDEAHPGAPDVRIAKQGTCWANTIGYGFLFYESDLHHLSTRGKVLVACLYYIAIYGGRIEDIPIDFASSTPLVTRLLADGIDETQWDRIVGYADRSQPRDSRPFPGSDSDFQMRVGINANVTNLTSTKTATAGDTVNIRLISPLDANESAPAGVFYQWLPTGALPNAGSIPGLQLDRSLMVSWFSVPDLTGGVVTQTIPNGMAGMSLWIQATSRGPVGSTQFPLALSDAQVIEIQ